MSPRPSRAPLLLASCLFFLSGATGLTYEVIWFKRLAHVFGSSSFAMAAVVASFLAGIGLGARLVGRWADRSRRPLLGYAICELAIGILAVLVPFELLALNDWTLSLRGAYGDQPVLFNALRFATSFAVIGPPCILMGATLPLLVRHLTIAGRKLGASTAYLYAINSLGAATGVAFAGFWALPRLGLETTNLAAAALNCAIAIAAYALSMRKHAVDGGVPDAGSLPRAREIGTLTARGYVLVLAACASGFASLSLQMVWGRELALLLGPTTYAFSAVVFVFICGIGLGSLAFRLVTREGTQTAPWIAGLSCFIVITTLIGHLAAPQLAVAVGAMKAQRADPGFNALLCAAVSFALEGLPTLAMGALFPALVQHTGADLTRAATTVGRLVAWNTLGSIGGALVASTLLFSAIGVEGTVMLALGLYAGVAFLVGLPAGDRAWRGPAFFLGAICVVAIVLPWRRADPRATNLGAYLYGPQIVDELGGEDTRVLFFEEGPTCNVAVLAQDFEQASANMPGAPTEIRNVRVNGKVDGSNFLDMVMQFGSAALPLTLRPEARKVLVIGMGTGTTAGSALLYPETQVTCCEIEPAMFEAARYFSAVNHAPNDSPRFTAVAEDGRSYIQGTEEVFDVIISEPSNPWIVGVSNLFTAEFYATARQRLGKRGLLVQWIQTYALSADQYALVARTVQAEFPHYALMRLTDNDTLLLASSARILPTRDEVARAQAVVDANPVLGNELVKHFRSRDVRDLLLSTLLLDEEGLQRLVQQEGGSGLNTDVNMRLEFEAPRFLFGRKPADYRDPRAFILSAASAKLHARLIGDWGWQAERLESLRALRTLFFQKNLQAQARDIVELALAYAPDDPEFMADSLLFAPPQDVQGFTLAAGRLVQLSQAEAWRAAEGFGQRGDHARAEIVLDALRAEMPDSPTLWTALAVVYANTGRLEESEAALKRVRDADPLNELAAELGSLFE